MDRVEWQYKPRFEALRNIVYCSALIVSMLALPAVTSAAADDSVPRVPAKYTTASAGVTVTKVRMYFDNKRPEITVKRNQPSPPLFAEVEFTGSGLLQGFWEVDGRLLSDVSWHVVPGKRVVLKTPDRPGIPTFDPGTHRVRFVISNPGGIASVEALYFVTAEEFALIPIKPLAPADKTVVDSAAIIFRWESVAAANSYRIEFFEKSDEEPFFSANTNVAEYALPDAVLRQKFPTGKQFSWKVRGIGVAGNIIAESPLSCFSCRTGK